MKINQNQKRDFVLENESTEEPLLDISFSSEEPVLRDFGYEILSHKPGCMRVRSVDGTLPLLIDHCTDDAEALIGLCKDIRVENGKGRCKLEFSDNNDTALMIEADMIQGIRRNISFGYLINKYEVNRSEDGGPDTVIVTDWEVYELSSVTVPADITVGVGRSIEDTKLPEPVEVKTEQTDALDEQITEVHTEAVKSADITSSQEQTSTFLQKETPMNRNEILSLQAFADKLGLGSECRELMNSEKSMDEIRSEIMTLANAKSAPVAASYDAKEIKEYDLGRAIVGLVDPSKRGLEWEVSQDLARKMGKSNVGLFIPTQVRANELLTTGNGADLKVAKYMGFLDALYNAVRTFQAGATRIQASGGVLTYIRQTGSATAAWTAENTAVANSSANFDVVTCTPKRLAAVSPYSMDLFLQSPETVSAVIARDLVKLHSVAIDAALINGSGAAGEPLGLLGTTGITDKSLGTAAVPTWAQVNALKGAVSKANYAFDSNAAWLTTPELQTKLETIQKATGNTGFICENGKINGYNCYESNNVPTAAVGVNHTMIFGQFSELALVDFAALNLVTDNLTGAASGLVKIISSQYCDVLVKQPAAFAYADDFKTA